MAGISRRTSPAMAFLPTMSAQKTWRKRDGRNCLTAMIGVMGSATQPIGVRLLP
jgi:hypothetical protein